MSLYFYNIIQLVSFIAACIFWKSLLKCKILLFIPFLLAVNLIELTAINFKVWQLKTNYPIYNSYFIVGILFYLYLFNRILALKGITSMLYNIFSILISVVIILNYFFVQGPNTFDTISYYIFDILLIVLSSFSLFKIALDDDVQISLRKNPYFIITTGTLLFALGSLVIFGAHEIILSYNIKVNGARVYNIISPILNVILYASYAYSFYLCKISNNK